MFILTQEVLSRFWSKLTNYIPDFLAGLLILAIGLTLASLLKRILITLFTFVKLENILQKTKLINKNEVRLWEEILAEILRWTVIILFLIPTLETWGLSRATAVLNQFLFYLPNVIVAVIIAFIGLIAANLVSDLVRHSINSLGAASANALAAFSKSALIFFTILVILNQLGIAQDLIRILFTGIVAMLAIAGGLAFGLGGRDLAREILENLQKKLS
jgi:hypothetical protein